MKMNKKDRIIGFFSIGHTSFLRILFVVGFVLAFASAASAQEYDIIEDTLEDGAKWAVVRPLPLDSWNGALILDHDGQSHIDGGVETNARIRWFLSQGYAYGGTNRAVSNENLRLGADHLVIVRQKFIDHYDEMPWRTVYFGWSQGVGVGIQAMEVYPDIFDGAAVSIMGGAGQVAQCNLRLDALWTLKTLVNPDSDVKIVNLYPDDPGAAAEQAAISDLIALAQESAAGRARLALAAAFAQVAPWGSPLDPEPAPYDYDAQFEQLTRPGLPPLPFGNFQLQMAPHVRVELEALCGGNISWNHGVNYTKQLARSGRADFVKAMYKKAGLNLKADLRTLKNEPRIAADPEAVAIAEQHVTNTGEIEGPIIFIDGIGQSVDTPSGKRAYQNTVRRAGNNKLLKITWTHRAGHTEAVSDLEFITGFQSMINYLDTGKWGDTSAAGMNAQAQEIASGFDFPDRDPLFIENKHVADQIRQWDVSDWGSYEPPSEGYKPGKFFKLAIYKFLKTFFMIFQGH